MNRATFLGLAGTLGLRGHDGVSAFAINVFEVAAAAVLIAGAVFVIIVLVIPHDEESF